MTLHPSIAVTDLRSLPPHDLAHDSRRLVRTFSGATIHRTSDAGGAQVPEHAHAWPVLSLFIAGGYHNVIDDGPLEIAAPSAVFYRRGDAHANRIGPFGHEQLEIEFDPAWLGPEVLARLDRPVRRVGGRAALASRGLLKHCQHAGAPEREVREAIRRFFEELATPEADPPAPPWLRDVHRMLCAPLPLPTACIADAVGLSPQWLTEAYRAFTGEGLAEAARRRRAEQAAHLLRTTDAPVAAIAASTGFCDQSHLVRVFREFYGCAPTRLLARGAGR